MATTTVMIERTHRKPKILAIARAEEDQPGALLSGAVVGGVHDAEDNVVVQSAQRVEN